APIGYGVDHAMHKLGDAGFALGRPHLAVEILAGDNISRGLRPIDRRFDVSLFKDDGAFVVADGGGTGLPIDRVVWGFSRLQPSGKMPRESNPFAIFLLLSTLQIRHAGTQRHCRLTHFCISPRPTVSLYLAAGCTCHLAPRSSGPSRNLSIYCSMTYRMSTGPL